MNWIYKDNPCKDCTDRPPDKGCGMHSKCERYAEWVSEKDKRKEQKHIDQKGNKVLDDFLIGNSRKRRETATGKKGGK